MSNPTPTGRLEDVYAWRVMLWRDGQFHSPLADGGVARGIIPLGNSPTITATCARHEPPAIGCECGIWGCSSIESLVGLVESIEFTAYAARDMSTGHHLAMLAATRVVVAGGVLRQAMPVARKPTHASDGIEVFPLYRDQLYPAPWWSRPTAREVVAKVVYGDPPNTWRGASFEMDRVIVRTEHSDDSNTSGALSGIPVEHVARSGHLAPLIRSHASRVRHGQATTRDPWWFGSVEFTNWRAAQREAGKR